MSNFNVVRGRKKPGRPNEKKTQQVTVRLNPEIVKAVAHSATLVGRSKSAVIEDALMGTKWIARYLVIQ